MWVNIFCPLKKNKIRKTRKPRNNQTKKTQTKLKKKNQQKTQEPYNHRREYKKFKSAWKRKFIMFLFLHGCFAQPDCSKHKHKKRISPGTSHIDTAGNVRGKQGFIDATEILWESVLVSKRNWKVFHLGLTKRTSAFLLAFLAEVTLLPLHLGSLGASAANLIYRSLPPNQPVLDFKQSLSKSFDK